MEHKVLLVDDDAAVRGTLTEVLRAEGYGVVTAANGREALGYLQNDWGAAPGLILLDLAMPIMNGEQFLQAYAERPVLPAVPVGIVSAFEPAFPADGAARVVFRMRKPVDPEALLDALQEWCLPRPRVVVRRWRAESVASSCEERSTELPQRPPPDDWGGARAYYLAALHALLPSHLEGSDPTEPETVATLEWLEGRGWAKRGMHPWDRVAKIHCRRRDPLRLAERLASYWLCDR